MTALFDPFAARGSRHGCPACNRVGTMTLSQVWRVQGFDADGKINFSLAGVMPKLPATLYHVITCGADDIEGCGWFCPGEYDGAYFVAIPRLKDEYEASR